MRLENKVCIITGATRGIGFDIAKAYLDQGAKIAICGSREETVNKALDQLLELGYNRDHIIALAIDLNDEAAIQQGFRQVYQQWGKIDVLVNNAGISSNASIEETSHQDFVHELNINLVAPFLCIKTVLAYMQENGGGSIINTSSMVAKYGSVNQVGYVSSKFGLNGLTIESSRELGKYNIRVNAVAPGVIATDMVKELVNEQTKNILTNMTPLQRMGEPSELAGAYVYLASDESSYTTGTIIDVNGGLIK